MSRPKTNHNFFRAYGRELCEAFSTDSKAGRSQMERPAFLFFRTGTPCHTLAAASTAIFRADWRSMFSLGENWLFPVPLTAPWATR